MVMILALQTQYIDDIDSKNTVDIVFTDIKRWWTRFFEYYLYITWFMTIEQWCMLTINYSFIVLLLKRKTN